MLNPDEATIDLKRYLKKLKYAIEHEADFTLFSTKIVKKKRVDDILCCVESSLPSDYVEFVKKNGQRKLRSSSYYVKIHEAIKNKFFFSTDVYKVYLADALEAIDGLSKSIDPDLRKILNENFGTS